ncbi:MAG: GNAT family N-acetyltransferase [Candidatus Berkelbacteria bacterium]
MKIRKATIDDLDRVIELDGFLYDKELEEFDKTLNKDWIITGGGRNHFRDRVLEKDGVVFVAEEADQVIGYVACSISDSAPYRKKFKLAELGSMFILENFRSQGVGGKLIAEFFRWAKDQKADRATVTASAGNESAIRFYRRNGFENYDLVLEKEL